MKKKITFKKLFIGSGLIGLMTAGLNLLDKKEELRIIKTKQEIKKTKKSAKQLVIDNYQIWQDKYLILFNKYSRQLDHERQYDWSNRYSDINKNFWNGINTEYLVQSDLMVEEMKKLYEEFKKEYGK